MKVWVYRDEGGELAFSDISHGTFWKLRDFIGTLDLDIKQEKKWVKKEKDDVQLDHHGAIHDKVSAWVPASARNVKVTYEVEE